MSILSHRSFDSSWLGNLHLSEGEGGEEREGLSGGFPCAGMHVSIGTLYFHFVAICSGG